MSNRTTLDKMRSLRSPGTLTRKDGLNLGQPGSFECLHCHYHVSTEPLYAGVQNRNHCPYCLWSRHVDWKEAGDRLAVCRAEMQPVGLVVKMIRKKYAPAGGGELMLVHLCRECGKVSINRLAADDDPDKVLEIFENSLDLGEEHPLPAAWGGITPLQPSEIELVEVQLFGRK
jgi:hypothetical protein